MDGWGNYISIGRAYIQHWMPAAGTTMMIRTAIPNTFYVLTQVSLDYNTKNQWKPKRIFTGNFKEVELLQKKK